MLTRVFSNVLQKVWILYSLVGTLTSMFGKCVSRKDGEKKLQTQSKLHKYLHSSHLHYGVYKVVLIYFHA